MMIAGPDMRILHNTTLNTLYNAIDAVKQDMDNEEFHFTVAHEDQHSALAMVADSFLRDYSETRLDFMPDGYVDWALDLCAEHSIDVFIPYRYRQELAVHADRFTSAGIRMLTAGAQEAMNILEAKPEFLDRVQGMGIPGTQYRAYRTPEEFDAAWHALYNGEDPLCIKPSVGIFGAGFHVLHPDFDDLKNTMTGNRHKLSFDGYRHLLRKSDYRVEMMIMPYLTGQERSVDFACLDGRLLASYTRRKTGRSQIIEHDDHHHEMARRIVSDLGLSGVLNLQTIEDCHGVPHILEVNSRTAGGMFKGLSAGVNLQLILLRELAGGAANLPVARKTVVADISHCIAMR